VKASHDELRESLRGRVTKHHRFLLRLHIDQIDALDAAIAKIDAEVQADLAVRSFSTRTPSTRASRSDRTRSMETG
jgi:transposase